MIIENLIITLELINIDLEFLASNIYNITLIESKKIRLSQEEFRKQLLDKYNKCLITGNDCLYELEVVT